jgi:hypothetical protein
LNGGNPNSRRLRGPRKGSRLPQRSKAQPSLAPGSSDINLLAWLATCVSIFGFLFYYRHGDILLYGDAIAHINIARRVFDSKTPGLLQLGTVWLPLPHLLMIPFIVAKQMWRSGAGGSIPSMAAYVFAVLGIFRLTRSALARSSEPDRYARFSAWTAAMIFAANPNLIYMQSTAMGETLYLAFFIWSVVYFADWTHGLNALTKCGVCLVAACFTRYDGWFLSAVMSAAAVAIWMRRRSATSPLQGGVSNPHPTASAPAIVRFLLLAASAPALWLAYNGIVYRNPLEFANGPYSARAIEKKTQADGSPGHPGSDNPGLAALYFLKSAEDNVAQNQWLQRAWILLCLASLILIVSRTPHRISSSLNPSTLAFLFLLVPLLFYALSVAYGGVPIFIPNWWPFTHYNVRYGLQLLPALVVGIAVLVYLTLRAEAINARVRLATMIILFALVGVSYTGIWQAGPICLKEAEVNMRTRNQLQLEVARWVEKLPPDSTLLMYLGDHVGALERAAFPLKHTINEGNHRVWKQPDDAQGLWEHALAAPGKYADYVLAFEGDPVWQAVHQKNLHELIELHVTGQPRAILYAAR